MFRIDNYDSIIKYQWAGRFHLNLWRLRYKNWNYKFYILNKLSYFNTFLTRNSWVFHKLAKSNLNYFQRPTERHNWLVMIIFKKMFCEIKFLMYQLKKPFVSNMFWNELKVYLYCSLVCILFFSPISACQILRSYWQRFTNININIQLKGVSEMSKPNNCPWIHF